MKHYPNAKNSYTKGDSVAGYIDNRTTCFLPDSAVNLYHSPIKDCFIVLKPFRFAFFIVYITFYFAFLRYL